MGLKVSVTSVMRLLKEEGYSLDHRRQGWKSRRVDLVGGGAVSIKEFFNPGTKEHYFEPVYYTGNPAQYWESKEFEDIRQAVVYINAHIEDAYHAFNDDLNTMHRVARKYIKKTATLVGTDSATIWAIAPENLERLIAGGFGTLLNAWNEGDFEEAEKEWRQHGGAIFHTGADGIFDVKIPTPEGNLPIVEEKGYMPPYGTSEYRKGFGPSY